MIFDYIIEVGLSALSNVPTLLLIEPSVRGSQQPLGPCSRKAQSLRICSFYGTIVR